MAWRLGGAQARQGTSRPSDAELMDLLLGTTGNLRAPVVVRGGTVLVGFNADIYEDELG